MKEEIRNIRKNRAKIEIFEIHSYVLQVVGFQRTIDSMLYQESKRKHKKIIYRFPLQSVFGDLAGAFTATVARDYEKVRYIRKSIMISAIGNRLRTPYVRKDAHWKGGTD